VAWIWPIAARAWARATSSACRAEAASAAYRLAST
jgi:hypothetical protein